jgi:enamine deaminase RidA (YjgF/YER057c/UK114 family)
MIGGGVKLARFGRRDLACSGPRRPVGLEAGIRFNLERFMSKIIRTEPGPILSKAVEYHGFVYLPGITARDTKQDIKGQTADVLAQIDAMLEHHGTDKTRLLQATIWVKHIKDRVLMNEVWTPWLPKDGAPARACVQAEMAAPEVLVEIMVTACK